MINPNIPKCPKCGSTKWRRDNSVETADELDPETGIWIEVYGENHEQNTYCEDCDLDIGTLEYDDYMKIVDAFDTLAGDWLQDWRASLKYLIEKTKDMLQIAPVARYTSDFDLDSSVQHFLDELQCAYDNSGPDEQSPP